MRPRYDDLLKAITQLQLHMATGDGVETAIHSMAHARLRGPSRRFGQVLMGLESGLRLRDALGAAVQWAERRKSRRLYALIFGALMEGGAVAEQRLQEITDEVLAEREQHAENKKKLLSALTKLVGILGIFPSLVPAIQVCAQLPKEFFDCTPIVQTVPPLIFAGFAAVEGLFFSLISWRGRR